MEQKSIFSTIYNRKELARFLQQQPEDRCWSMSEEQFLRRVEMVEGLRDLAGVIIKNEVTDMLLTNGGKAGRFKW